MSTNSEQSWSQDELARLARLKPELVAFLPDGTLAPTVTREEFIQLAQRYPTLALNTGTPSAEARAREAEKLDPEKQRAMEARYPTMFKR